MSSGPLIGIPTQTLEAIPGEVPRAWVMGQTYVRVICAAGGVPYLVPLLTDQPEMMRAIYDQLSGIFLTGGVDVDPRLYGEEISEQCMKVDPERDEIEQMMVRWAMEDGKPVLGVCRGIQIINVACGGSLHQDLSTGRPDTLKHDYFPQYGYERSYIAHPTTIDKDSRLGRILGVDQAQINSMHHQAIKDLAPGFRVTASAPDGIIEAFEGTNGQFLIAVQWHPEELTTTNDGARRLFEELIAASKQYQLRNQFAV